MRKSITKAAACLLTGIMLLFAGNGFATIRYVKLNATGTGTSWADASGSIQSMIFASSANDSVWVKADLFVLPWVNGFINMKDSVSLLGGFSGSETSSTGRIPGATTTLQGNSNTQIGVIHFPYLSSSPATRLDGFDLIWGTYGIMNEGASPVISNCNIHQNSSAGIWNIGNGFVEDGYEASSPVYINCNIYENSSYASGKGVRNEFCTPTFINCYVKELVDQGGGVNIMGGAMNNLYSTVTMDRCMLWGTAYYGGGIYNYSSAVIASNSIIMGSGTHGGGAIYGFGDMDFTSVYTNCTILSQLSYLNPSCIHTDLPLSNTFRNCIIQSITPGATIFEGNSTPTVGYSYVMGTTVYPGTGNTIAYPSFTYVDLPLGGDGVVSADDGFKLGNCSPLINAGNSAWATGNDYAGAARIQGDAVDMGAYEFSGGTNGNPAITSLATNGDIGVDAYRYSRYISANGTCRTLVGLQPLYNFTNIPAFGPITAHVWVDTTQHPNYVKRHYQVTTLPALNISTNAAAKITLYFTDGEFAAYNAASATNPPLPLSTDAPSVITTRKANLQVQKYSGTSSDNSGLPATYPGQPLTIDPSDNDIIWDSTSGVWSVSFDVVGFSGFFVNTTGSIPLALKLLSFTANNIAPKHNLLHWTVAAEDEGTVFEITRSDKGSVFIPLGTVKENGSGDYSFNDNEALTGNNYYRLKITDASGTITYSPVAIVNNMVKGGSVNLWPSPASHILHISNTDESLKGQPASIINMQGRTVYQFLIEHDVELSVDNWTPGIYMLRLSNGQVMRIVKE
jgi:hypothetical protein